MIDIPGYRILRPLGRGGMASVYLALQESVQREVALKVMSPTLLGDKEFSERFLREARIAARLRHPHIVQVHDVGRTGEFHFIAMEYLAGGPALERAAPPRGLAYGLRITREIAGALDYAHRRGVIHRDIKPDNIMLRDDGDAVLSDFGIARANDNVRMTLDGTIMGTPHYMSPEQASAGTVDGRSDLYSLGIVFYELLVGQVPYDAEDWVSVGLKHLSAPLPQLPVGLQRLQPLLDQMLAKDVSERFQTGADLVAAIEEIEAGLSDRRVQPSSWRHTGIAAPPHPTAAPTAPLTAPPRHPAASTQRWSESDAAAAAEPVMGSLDELLSEPTPRARRRAAATAVQPATSGNRWLIAFLVVALLLSLGYAFREPLTALLPQTRHEDLLARAELALRERRLSDSRTAGARELFQAALALDPDDERARAGLRQTGEALLQRAAERLAADDLEAARAALNSARDLGLPQFDIDALDASIRARESRGVEFAGLIAQAQAALAEGRLDQAETSALALFRRALASDASSTIAQVGLRDTLGQLLERARAQIGRGELDAAEQQIEVVAAIDAAHLALPDLRAELAAARQNKVAGVAQRLQDADALLRQGRLTQPAAANARESYRAVLAQEPGNAAAEAGLRRVAEALLAQADRQSADYEFDRAQALIDEASATAPRLPALRAAQSKLDEMRQRRAQFAAGAVLSAEQQAQVQRAVDEAAAAAARGNLMYPPGESAFDRYRAALSIDPNHADAKAGLAALPAAARRLFETALAGNRLSAARGYVEGLETLAPGDSGLPDMKRRLASSLIGYASERLGAGELRQAREAVLQAGELDPNHPDLASLRARIEQSQ